MSISILIVDDSEADRYLLKRYLQKTSLDLVYSEAADGQDALELFSNYTHMREESPDKFPPLVVFLDINMPRVNGFAFLEEFDKLRVVYDLDATIVVMFSSSPRQDDKEKALQWPFVKEFIIKGGFSPAELDGVLRNLIGQSST